MLNDLDEKDLRACHRQELRKLRSCFNRVLNNELALVRDIQTATACEPVRVHVILDRAQQLEQLLTREIAKLEAEL